MIDIVAVLRAEDAALDFLSVIGGEEGEVHVLCGDTGERLVLPAGRPLAERLDALAPLIGPVDEHAASPGTEALAALVEGS
ncbi:hypothetical protein G3I43_10435, partial [Streptomyces anulatus]|nr:hypothetical protein [Streptomyces anulatus]